MYGKYKPPTEQEKLEPNVCILSRQAKTKPSYHSTDLAAKPAVGGVNSPITSLVTAGKSKQTIALWNKSQNLSCLS